MDLIRKISFMALLSAVLFTAASQERLLVFTDPHLLSPALVVNPGQPYTDAINNDNKMFDLGAPIMQAMVDTILGIKPTAVLVSGDLSKDGERRSRCQRRERGRQHPEGQNPQIRDPSSRRPPDEVRQFFPPLPSLA